MLPSMLNVKHKLSVYGAKQKKSFVTEKKLGNKWSIIFIFDHENKSDQ